MAITPFLTIILCLIGWHWSMRAGIRIATWARTGTAFAKRVAIGNSLVALIPFAIVVIINWPRSG